MTNFGFFFKNFYAIIDHSMRTLIGRWWEKLFFKTVGEVTLVNKEFYRNNLFLFPVSLYIYLKREVERGPLYYPLCYRSKMIYIIKIYIERKEREERRGQ